MVACSLQARLGSLTQSTSRRGYISNWCWGIPGHRFHKDAVDHNRLLHMVVSGGVLEYGHGLL